MGKELGAALTVPLFLFFPTSDAPVSWASDWTRSTTGVSVIATTCQYTDRFTSEDE
jgi:hypothetical protein